MELVSLATSETWVADALRWLWAPIAQTPWADWRDFWQKQVFDDRFLVCRFLPLVPILLLFSRRHLRTGIILTAALWMAFVFGAAYAMLWLAVAALFYRFGERYAVELRRTDVVRWGPHAAAIAVVCGFWLAGVGLQHVRLPEGVNEWLTVHLPWVYPLGARPFLWEPWWMESERPQDGGAPVQLLAVMLANPHNLGIAYFVIRMLHYLSEINRGGITAERRSFQNFMAYVCYAPALMQGPIERFGTFQDEMDTCHERRSWRNVAPAMTRIAWGILKNLIVIWYFKPFLSETLGLDRSVKTYFDQPETIGSYAVLYFGVYAIIFGLYLQFSGYCDVSAGIARLLGYRQIENFNWPWQATSLRDFWRRWHISLSSILRDYLYIPFGGNRRHVTLNLCATFVLCGLWHVPIPRMFAWGVMMGLMLAVNQHWSAWMKRLDARPEGVLSAIRRGFVRLRPLPEVLSWALTMHFFVMSLLTFFGGTGANRVTRELIMRPVNWLLGT